MVDTSWIERAACSCEAGWERCRDDDAVVSQYGKRDGGAGTPCVFRDGPTRAKAVGMSVQAARKTESEMADLVAPGGATAANVALACIRFTTVGSLRRAGFVVLHTPAAVAGSVHCTVCWAEGPEGSRKIVEWNTTAAEAFEACFSEQE